MPIEQVADDLHVIRGLVNVHILKTDDGLAVLDTGFPGSAPKIRDGVRAIGGTPADVRHIIVTHAHPDHIGSAAALKRETGAIVWAHPVDAPILEAGTGFRPIHASPGLVNRLLTRFVLGRITSVEPVHVDRLLEDGGCPSFLPDLQAIHAPGHCAGQIAFLWRRHGGVLFTADTCINMRGPKLPPACEDVAQARRSLERLKQLDFQMICFGHGRPVLTGGDTLLRATSFP